MKIRLITDRGVWLDGKRRGAGYEADVTNAEADALADNGLAEKVQTRKVKKSSSDE